MKINACCFLLFPICLSPAVFAANDTSSLDGLLDLSIEDLLEVEVSGPTRTLKNLHNVPAAVTAFRRNELQNMGIDFLFELLSYVPGFQTSRDNDYGASYFYSSRGSDTGQDTTAILLLIDGVPRQEIRNASASALSSLMPIDRIEQIEVMRGPGSALYGSGAFLGVINIVTVEGNNSIKATAGQAGRKELQGQFSLRSDRWQFDTFLSGYQDDGEDYLLDDKLKTAPTATSDPQSTENYAFRLGHRDTVVTVEHVNIESEDYYSVSAINNDLNEQRHFANFAAIEQGMQWGNLKSTVQLSYSENELNYTAQATNVGQLAAVSSPSSSEALVGDVLYQSHSWLLQWLNDWYIDDDNSLQFGVERQQEQLDTARVLANFDTQMLANRQFPITYSPAGDIYNKVVETGSRNIAGIYAQLQHRLNARTDITAGARYDDYEDFDGQFSMRFSVVRRLSEHDFLKVFYGEAFRAPSLNQMNVRETLTVARNPDLEAETIRTTELVWLSQQALYSFSVGAFYNVIDNSIESSGFLNGKRTNVNVDQEISNGLEFETSVQLDSYWLVRAGFTEFLKLPESSFRESERLFSLILNYQRERWWANVSGYYNSERKMPVESDGVIDGFAGLNTKVGYQFENAVRVHLQIKNLLDEDIASSPQSTAINTAIPYRGREASVGVTYAF